jgi:hypothetical protein
MRHFDARALLIKSWSAPLLAAGVGLGANNHYVAIILALVVAAVFLWALESPFQIFTAWGEVWHRYYRHPKSLIPILQQPFAWMPYLPIIVIGIYAIFYVALARS